ncbi:BTB/POZ domain-containing protein KCTD7-like isoform X1 [Branchiostoma floridae x Branchiostoma belcheri]
MDAPGTLRRGLNKAPVRAVTQFPAVIPLNVGGHDYTTSLSTLRKYESSMLAAMFSGRYHVIQDEQKRYFIDRDGDLFQYILKFLRDSEVPPHHVAVQVYKEALYYGLHPLIEILKSSPPVRAEYELRESLRNALPKYKEFKEKLVDLAYELASASHCSEISIHQYREFLVEGLQAQTLSIRRDLTRDESTILVGPLNDYGKEGQLEESMLHCVLFDLREEGFNVDFRMRESVCEYWTQKNKNNDIPMYHEFYDTVCCAFTFNWWPTKGVKKK